MRQKPRQISGGLSKIRMMNSVLEKSGNGLMVWMLESRSLVCAIQLPILELAKDFPILSARK